MDAATSAPITGAAVLASGSGKPEVRTDAEGHYVLRGLAPGQYLLTAFAHDFNLGEKAISVSPGEALTFDFHLKAAGQISGRVLDENDDPVPGVEVLRLASSYQNGDVRYLLSGRAVTNDLGEYVMSALSEQARLLAAVPGWTGSFGLREVEAVSLAPDDPKDRRQATIFSFYPDATEPENALPVTLRPGEQRERADIRLHRAPSLCVEGVLERPASQTVLSFLVVRLAASGVVSSFGGFAGTVSGPDFRIRVCDLFRGNYGLAVTAPSVGTPALFGSTPFSIVDGDVHGIRVAVQPAVMVAGEVALLGEQPASPLKGNLNITLTGQGPLHADVEESPVPGQFSFRLFPMGDYSVSVRGIPTGWYLKDVTYGGVSVSNRFFRLGDAAGNSGLRVSLARDGGFVTAVVRDAEGKPVAGAGVTIFPASAASDGELAASIVAGLTDQNGRYETAMLPPGKYYALAAETPIDTSSESLAKLRGAWNKATEVELSNGGTKQVSLRPVEIE